MLKIKNDRNSYPKVNQYISKIEVIKYILLIVILEEFYEYKNILKLFFENIDSENQILDHIIICIYDLFKNIF